MNRPRLETTPRPALPACLLILATALTFGCSAEEQTVETVRLDAPPAQRDRQLEKLSSSDHVALLESCLSHYRPRVKDYTCTFSKQERMDGRLGARQLIDVRFREDPFSVAMTWRENPPRGDRVLYVEGRWDGKMLVRPTGVLARAIVPVAVRDPDGKEAMAETRRPVTMFGFKRSLQSLLDVYREAKKQGRLKESSGGFVEVKGRTAVVLVRELRPRKGETDSGSAPEHPPLTRIYIDTESLVPIMIEGYTAADGKKLSSRYLYEDVKFNVGLTDADFTPQSLDMPDPQVQPAR